MKKTFIVTGATGFVGNNLVRQLIKENYAVLAHARSINKAEEVFKGVNVELAYGDICSMQTVEQLFIKARNLANGGEIIFVHTASVVRIGGTKKQYENMAIVNSTGTQNVIESCLKNNCRLLYVSSVHAIPERRKRRLITEIETFDPNKVIGKYAKSKAQATQLVMDAIKQRNLDAVIVHPSGITGPNDYSSTHLYQMVEDYIDGRIPAATTGGYDFVDVRDVAKGIIAASLNGKSGDCFLLSNKYYTVREILDYLQKITKGKKIKLTLPIFIAQLGQPFLTMAARIAKKRPLYTSYSLYTLKSNSNFSHARATAKLGYVPRGIYESLTDTHAFILSRRNTNKK